MSDLKQRALALYKPPFHRVHGYIFDADHRMVADDAAAKNEDAALRVRGWGRIQYLEDAEALQDAAGDMIAEALTEYWQRRAQPEATAPARQLLHTMEHDDGRIGWYFNCDGHYIDVEKDENGKYSVFFRDRATDKEGWLDQADTPAQDLSGRYWR